MISKALVIVPHPDDEINVAGTMIVDLIDKNVDVYVLYTTNGDYYPWQYEKRQKEALSALKELGVNKNHTIFLGYGDGWLSTKHIYNSAERCVKTSHSLHKETYSIPEHQEYSCYESNKHNLYTRENYLLDLSKAIYSIKAELIFCVDFDCHYDHRATSLFFEEAMRMLICKYEYRPIILKRFAYASCFTGVNDYYCMPFRETILPRKEEIQKKNENWATDVPAYAWDNRIRFSVSDKNKCVPISGTPIFKAAKMHKSQHITYRVMRIINDDAIFWWRNTTGLQYDAQIHVSSGNASCLNDFKLYDSSDICVTNQTKELTNCCVWTPEEGDSQKKICVTFEQPVKIAQVSFYENYDPVNNINDILISFSNGYKIHTGEMRHDGSETVITFEQQIDIVYIEMRITNYCGKYAGLTEIEIYSEPQRFPYNEIPVNRYDQQKKEIIVYNSIISKMYRRLDCLSVYMAWGIDRFLNPLTIIEKVREKNYCAKLYKMDSSE